MNGVYRDDPWDHASHASSYRYHEGPPMAEWGHDYPSSAYDRGRMSPYRADHRGHSNASNGYSSDNGSVVSSEDGPTYVLEHLATFRVSPESDLVYPADGMRRLLHMEKTSGIWTQKMTLRLDKKWVYIQSHENGDVVEKFPMELIREPTAFTSEDPKELYNNIFIFVVAEDPKRNYQNPTEMHIFQCLRISAKDVVEDMKLFMSGKGLSGRGRAARATRAEHIPPPPQEPAPEPPLANGYRADFCGTWGSHGFQDTVAADTDLCMIAWAKADCPLSGCQTNNTETMILLLRVRGFLAKMIYWFIRVFFIYL